MKPPSDALRHSLQKLAEARANRSTTTTPTSSVPPPPYTLSVSRPTGTRTMTVDRLDDYYYAEEPSPITIQIDNSIDVTGNGNHVMLPSESSTPTTSEGRNSTPSLAGVIIGALSRANALRDEAGAARPINITVNSGMRIHGENNVITRGAPKPAESTDTVGGTLKRRASSEPMETAPETQRRRMT
ncbi:unnamed protein product [Penicillium salamii]|uniref:Uncharacterized protein n=1 Tax=Penicillium salamii TaxID=1612424 RepID=A0A9W4J6F8_9EURO|nr:unnamed protein product [Penicillium salamii]CAG8172874.1 unnamed protein product [Penicillium salamii]CAG8228753.1 unnamed protein product [Penicillium salamii]CAG8321951.1 unnamed protein product [Penicillium salamii]CAG8372316.1 unnamed protein product [Penicillium salamii]